MNKVNIQSSRAPQILSEAPFAALQREMNRLFSSFDRGWPTFGGVEFRPSTDVVETDSEIKISAEIPGLKKEDVRIELDGAMLTISGEKKSEIEEKTEKRHVVERSYGSFSRSLQLPEGVKVEDIDASIANGVLTVAIKKPAVEKPEPKTVDIKSSE